MSFFSNLGDNDYLLRLCSNQAPRTFLVPHMPIVEVSVRGEARNFLRESVVPEKFFQSNLIKKYLKLKKSF